MNVAMTNVSLTNVTNVTLTFVYCMLLKMIPVKSNRGGKHREQSQVKEQYYIIIPQFLPKANGPTSVHSGQIGMITKKMCKKTR